jgi:hypothetical protein
MYYLDGTGVDKNTEKADEYAKMALENGFCEVNEWLQKKRAEYQGARSSSSVSELSLLDVAQESALPEIHPDSSVVPLNDAPIKTEIRNVEHSSAAFDEERSWEQAGFWPDALVSGEGTEAPPSRLQSELLLETAHFYYGKGMMSEAFQLFDELASMGNEHGKFFVAKMIMEGNDPSGAMKKATRYATELGMDVGAKLAHNVDLDKARFSEIKEAHQHFEENIRPGDLTSKIVPENSSCSVESGTEKRQTPRLITINYQTS